MDTEDTQAKKVKLLSDLANFIQLGVIIFGGGMLYQKVEVLVQDQIKLQAQIQVFNTQIIELSRQNAQFAVRIDTLEAARGLNLSNRDKR